jgi:hypothetical protein
MKEAKKKRGRKPRGVTEEERKAAAREYAKEYYRKNKKAIRAKQKRDKKNTVGEAVLDKALYARLEKLENEVEKLKWELFGRQT